MTQMNAASAGRAKEHPCPRSDVIFIAPRAKDMADAIRMIVHRDGNVTEPALIGEGFSAAEIVEYFNDASNRATAMMTSEGTLADRAPQIIEKSIAAQAWTMPLTAGDCDNGYSRAAWRAYCAAVAAFKLDPWAPQRERCLAKLGEFLGGLSLLPTESNRIVAAVSVTFKQKEIAA